MTIANQMLSTAAERVDRGGECGRLTGSDTGHILRLLGSGEPLSIAICESLGAYVTANSRIRIHTDGDAARFAERIEAEAFTIGRHIVFAAGRYNPQSKNGERLLRHELAHVAQEEGREDRICCWFTNRNNGGRQFHGLRSSSGPTVRGPSGQELPETYVGRDTNVTHEDLTRQTLAQVGGFGGRARDNLLDWVAKIDDFKRADWNQAVTAFPQLRSFSEMLVHSWRGEGAGAIGMTGTDLYLARRANSGLIITLLKEAISHYQRGFREHALKLLGISLHTIQDFYSHKVDIRDRRYHPTSELREYARAQSNPSVNVSVMEDDPKIAPDRWLNAWWRSAEQLAAFRQALDKLGLGADLAGF